MWVPFYPTRIGLSPIIFEKPKKKKKPQEIKSYISHE